MKQFFKRKAQALVAWFKSTFATVMTKAEKAGPVVKALALIAAIVVGIVLFVLFVVGAVLIGILVPGMFLGGIIWFVWTYLGLGAYYFPMIDPIYQIIPYWHFAFGTAVLILIWKFIRNGGKVNPGKSKGGTINAQNLTVSR